MELYSYSLSLFSAKVRIVLAEKQLGYVRHDVPFDPERGYVPKHPQVAALNPKQQVPVLTAGDLALYDSTVILEYLEDLAPDPPLYPREPKAKARCRLLELEADEVFFAPVATLIRRRYARAAGVPEDPQELPQSAAAFAAHCERLSGQLGDAEYLCGAFSVADISHLLVACFGLGLGLATPELANLNAWFARVGSRPSVAHEIGVMTEAARVLPPSQPAREVQVSP